MTKQCPKCSAENRPNAQFCISCGQLLDAAKCPNGHPMDPGWTKCIYCENQNLAAQPPKPAEPAPGFGAAPPPFGAPAPPPGFGAAAPPPPGYGAPPPGFGAPPPGFGAGPGQAGPAMGGAQAGMRGPTLPDDPFGAQAPPAAPGGRRGPTVPDMPSGPPPRNLDDPFGAPAPMGGAPAKPAAFPPSGFAPPAAAPPAAAPGGAAKRRQTMYSPGDGPAAGAAASAAAAGVPAAETRKIVGVLVTYTWRQEGQIFPVREGRTRIGRDPECDVVIGDDSQLSRVNTTIVYRASGSRVFTISDADSMNGTLVNGLMVEAPQQLDNYSSVRAGSTVFTFIAIHTPAQAGAPEAGPSQPNL